MNTDTEQFLTYFLAILLSFAKLLFKYWPILKNWVVCLFLIDFLEVLCKFWILTFFRYMYCKYFLLVCSLSFHTFTEPRILYLVKLSNEYDSKNVDSF